MFGIAICLGLTGNAPRLIEFDFRQLFAYAVSVDKAKENGAVLIAAVIVAAIRLRGEEIKPSPKLNAVIHDSILLARLVLAQMERGNS